VTGTATVRDPAGVAGAPFSMLLSQVWIAFAIEADGAVEAGATDRVRRLFRISLAMWCNGLRFIDGDGITVGDLSARAHARCNIGGLERWGWITVGDTGAGRRDGYGTGRGVTAGTVLRPTRAGAYARRLWPQTVADVEQRWQARFGTGVVGRMRAALPFAGQMPWSPPEVHPPDGFRTHVVDGPADDGDVPLPGLLGRALTALTLELERDAAVSMPVAADVLRVIGGDVIRLRDLPALSGLSKEAIAMVTGYLGRAKLAELRAPRSIMLTASGRGALDAYRDRAAGPGDGALQACLTEILSQREALAEGLRPAEGCWRGEKPYLAQTRRVLADPVAALPWHPMVLHRGGWPDGS
jgi:hypothetical protein